MSRMPFRGEWKWLKTFRLLIYFGANPTAWADAFNVCAHQNWPHFTGFRPQTFKCNNQFTIISSQRLFNWSFFVKQMWWFIGIVNAYLQVHFQAHEYFAKNKSRFKLNSLVPFQCRKRKNCSLLRRWWFDLAFTFALMANSARLTKSQWNAPFK